MGLAEITNAVTDFVLKRNSSWVFLLNHILYTCIDKKYAQAASCDNQVQRPLILVV